MAISITPFGTLADGSQVDKITLKNKAGTTVSVLSFGVTVQSLLFEGKDVVLGFEKLEDYLSSSAYIGASVGRVCNRIDKGKFTLNGQTYQLACNESARDAHLHGGMVGYSHRVWAYEVLQEETPCVRFTLHSPDGDEGYPGSLDIVATVSLTEDNSLCLCYEAVGDQDTPVNFTNHTYFNLNGCDGGTVANTYMRIAADEFTPVNERLIPTGAYQSVAGTALDLRQDTLLGNVFTSTDPIVAPVGGIDHNFVLAYDKRPMTEVVWAHSPATGIRLTCSTDQPGVQVYTGNATDENTGKYGLCWGKHQGFCVETQFFPDSVNQPLFPSIILPAGETYSANTIYHFSRVEE